MTIKTTDLTVKLPAVHHRLLPKLVRACAVRGQDGHRKNIFLTGPTGSGKSTAARQVAEMFGIDFDYIGQVNMPHEVVGYRNTVTGEWAQTAFTKIFINGGVIVMEEMDAWSPNATLATNVPLANGYLSAPDGTMHKRHPDCVIIACANTWGAGATAEYVGRNKLDNAYLNRFGIRFSFEYDSKLEDRAVGSDMQEVAEFVRVCRHNAARKGLKVVISPRSSIEIADMVRAGFSLLEASEMNFLAELSVADRKTVLDGTDDYFNLVESYDDAFASVFGNLSSKVKR